MGELQAERPRLLGLHLRLLFRTLALGDIRAGADQARRPAGFPLEGAPHEEPAKAAVLMERAALELERIDLTRENGPHQREGSLEILGRCQLAPVVRVTADLVSLA